jgi:hypothetical protein
MNIPLYKYLQRHASAPNTGFDKFVVGRVNRLRADLRVRLQNMLTGNEPTGGQLILAENGNGKTILNKSLQEEASNINLSGAKPTFDVLFSRVSFSQNPTNIGVGLAKNLRRTYKEPSDITYASIAAEMLNRFSQTYKPNLTVRWMTVPVKIGLNYALKKYEEYIQGVIETTAEAAVGNVDQVFKGIDFWIRRVGVKGGFKKYARAQRMSSFLEAYVGEGQQGYRTVEELNEALYNDLAASFGREQPQDMVRTLASMARLVECKVLILQIDDCNTPEAVDFLVPIAESFNEFNEPRLFLIASAVPEEWRQSIDRGADLTAKHRVEVFFNPVTLTPPTSDELKQLAEKLENLIKAEEAENGRTLSWPNDAKAEVLSRCEGESYREATKKLIDDAEKYIR